MDRCVELYILFAHFLIHLRSLGYHRKAETLIPGLGCCEGNRRMPDEEVFGPVPRD